MRVHSRGTRREQFRSDRCVFRSAVVLYSRVERNPARVQRLYTLGLRNAFSSPADLGAAGVLTLRRTVRRFNVSGLSVRGKILRG